MCCICMLIVVYVKFVLGKKKNGGGILAYGSGGESGSESETADNETNDQSCEFSCDILRLHSLSSCLFQLIQGNLLIRVLKFLLT